MIRRIAFAFLLLFLLHTPLSVFASTTTPSYVSGYWLSDPWDLSSITNAENSFIEYCACARNGADVEVKVAITNSTSTEPSVSDFTLATTTTTIPGITAGDNLYGKYLWLKIEMEPNWTATGTPCLCRINLAINDVATTTSAHNALQSLSYTYDAVGNITQVKDLSGFGGRKTVNYTYDDLHRLTNASTTVPASGGYNQTFSYDRVGNILTSPQGSYTYTETGFTNPHGATAVGGTSLTYDDNGNVTDYGNDDYVWNYRDRLTKSTVGGVNTFYGYDFNNDRVAKGDGTATTTYANKYYNQLGATTTKHVFDNSGTLLATIEGDGEATSTLFAHTDHLGSVTVSVDEDGDVVENSDFYPFGGLRVNTTETGFVEQRKHTGNELDTESNLTYGEARYRNQDVGRWLTIDPVVLNLITDKRRNAVLNDPQLQNSYNYARNNPLIFVDEEGEFIQAVYAGGIGFVVGGVTEYIGDVVQNRAVEGQKGPGSFLPREGFTGRAIISSVETAATAVAFSFNPLYGIGATPAASLLGDFFAGDKLNLQEATIKTGTTILTAGLLKGTSGVPGKLPNFGTKAFFFGEHAQRWSTEALLGGILDAGVNTFVSTESGDKNKKNEDENGRK